LQFLSQFLYEFIDRLATFYVSLKSFHRVLNLSRFKVFLLQNTRERAARFAAQSAAVFLGQ
jgi:hypothetical protein